MFGRSLQPRGCDRWEVTFRKEYLVTSLPRKPSGEQRHPGGGIGDERNISSLAPKKLARKTTSLVLDDRLNVRALALGA
jgi:hypothetical protein